MSFCMRRWLLLLLTFAMMSATARAESLADAMVYAYEKSNLLEQQRNLVRIEDEDVAIAQASLRPTLDYFATVTKTRTTRRVQNFFTQRMERQVSEAFNSTLGIQLQWTLFDSGARRSRVAAAKQVVQAARHALTGVEQQVLIEAVDAYLRLRQDIKIVALRQSNLRLIMQELRAAEERFAVGEVTRTDVALAEARRAGAQSALAAAQGQVEISRALYELVIGRPPGRLSAPPPPPQLPNTLDAAKALALQGHPSIRQLQHTVKASELQFQATVQDRVGQLSTTSSIEMNAGRGDGFPTPRTGSVGLSYNQPIYSGGSLAAISRRAQLALNASRSQLAQQGRQVTEAVSRAWARLAVARAQIQASRAQAHAATLAFEGTREEVNFGARTTLDVLNAEQELLAARTAVLRAETDAYLAVYGVLATTGLLTTQHLGLSVERHDPDEYAQRVHKAPAFNGALSDKLNRVFKRIGAE